LKLKIVNVNKICNKEFQTILLGDICDVKSGLGTGDNSYYMYKEENAIGSYRIIDHKKTLSDNELKKISSNEKIRIKIITEGIPKTMFNGKTIIPTDKGGESDIEGGRLSNYFAPTKYFLDYSQKNVKRLRTLTIGDRKRFYGIKQISDSDEETLAAVIRNPIYYFKSGLTFSDVGLYAPTFRLNSDSVFDHRGNCIFIKGEFKKYFSLEYLLGVLCSKFSRYLQKNFINNTVGFQVEDIKKIPIPLPKIQDKKMIEELVQKIIKKQTKDLTYEYQKYEQMEIDKLICKIFHLEKDFIEEIDSWFIRKYPKLSLDD